MTGLVPGKDKLLEVAVIVTDGDLTPLEDGLVRVIRRSEEELRGMDEWCVAQHGKVRAPPAWRDSS
jgi:oligoribonuclease